MIQPCLVPPRFRHGRRILAGVEELSLLRYRYRLLLNTIKCFYRYCIVLSIYHIPTTIDIDTSISIDRSTIIVKYILVCTYPGTRVPWYLHIDTVSIFQVVMQSLPHRAPRVHTQTNKAHGRFSILLADVSSAFKFQIQVFKLQFTRPTTDTCPHYSSVSHCRHSLALALALAVPSGITQYKGEDPQS